MPLFGPNIKRLQARGNVDGLIQVLGEHKDERLRQEAAAALGELNPRLDAAQAEQVLAALKAALDQRDTSVHESVVLAIAQISAAQLDTHAMRHVLQLLGQALRSKDGRVRELASTVLARIGAPATETLVALLGNIRARYAHQDALDALVQVGAPAVEPVLALLTSRSRPSADAVLAQVLDKLGWRPTPDESGAWFWLIRDQWARCAKIGEPAIPTLIRAVQTGDITIRQRASRALVQIGAPAVEPLAGLLTQKQKGDVHLTVTTTLAKIGAPAVLPLIDQLAAKKTERSAAGVLASIGAPAWEPLIDTLGSGTPSARIAAAGLLARIARAAPDGDMACCAVLPLVQALDDADESVRRAAFDALSQIGTRVQDAAKSLQPAGGLVPANLLTVLNAKVQLEQALAQALQDPSPEMRLAAVDALAQSGGDAALASLTVLLTGDDETLRQAAVEGLDALGQAPESGPAGAVYWVLKEQWDKCVEIGALAVEPLLSALEDKRRTARRAAARALGQIGDPRAVTALVRLLEDQDDSVCKAAGDALVQIGAPSVEALGAALREHKPWRRDRAAKLLGQIGGTTGDARALSLLLLALGESNQNLRLAVTQALGAFDDPRATATLVGLLEDAKVSEAAYHSLRRLDWQPGPSLTGARYWLHKGDWKKCAEMGAQGVRLYLDTLDADARSTRQVAARALVQIYRSEGLPEGSRQRILEHRGTIIAKHRDESKYTSVAVNTGGGCMEDNYDVVCRLSGFHVDRTIGVEFPL